MAHVVSHGGGHSERTFGGTPRGTRGSAEEGRKGGATPEPVSIPCAVPVPTAELVPGLGAPKEYSWDFASPHKPSGDPPGAPKTHPSYLVGPQVPCDSLNPALQTLQVPHPAPQPPPILPGLFHRSQVSPRCTTEPPQVSCDPPNLPIDSLRSLRCSLLTHSPPQRFPQQTQTHPTDPQVATTCPKDPPSGSPNPALQTLKYPEDAPETPQTPSESSHTTLQNPQHPSISP